MKKIVSVLNEYGQPEFVSIDKIVKIVSFPNLHNVSGFRTGILGAKNEIICVSSESAEVISERINEV